MLTDYPSEYPCVIIRIQDQLFGVSAKIVKAMVAMPQVFSLPEKQQWVRGVINLRDEVHNLIDLRSRLGLKSYLVEISELIQMMEEREQDHRNWLLELENSVKEDREFTLAIDPHKCAFGKWRDNYEAKTFTIKHFLKKFDDPHQKIHDIAQEVISQKGENGLESALAIIEWTRQNELARMIDLFEEFRTMIQELTKLEIALILDCKNTNCALAVDSIESVEMLKEDSVEPVSRLLSNYDKTLVPLIGKRRTSDEIVLILDENQLFTIMAE